VGFFRLRRSKLGKIDYKLSGVRNVGSLPTKKKVPTLMALPDALRSQKSRQETQELANMSANFTLDSGGRQKFLADTGQHSRYKTCTFESGKPIIRGKTLNLHVDNYATAIELFKPTWIVGLDSPIQPSSNPAEQERRFQESIEMNAKWAIDTIALRDKHYPSVKVILPLQAQNLNHLNSYWRQIKSLNCDSVGLPMRCFKRDQRLIDFLIGIHDLGIRNVHLLGSCRFGAICVSAYLIMNNLFNSISMDSGTWRQAADHGGILIPYDLRQVHIDDRGKIEERARKLSVTWKKKIKNVLAQAGGKEERKALREFNYSAIEETIRAIEAHAASPSEMREFLFEKSTRTNDINKIINSLEMIALKSSSAQ
jgi:hypothetical protein